MLLDHDSRETVRGWAKELHDTYDKIRTLGSDRRQLIKKRHDAISPRLSRRSIMDLDESGFTEIIKYLWAFNWWKSKDYPTNNILNNNGIEKIRRSLNDLLYGSNPLETRFDDFNVKHLGMAAITEIMSITSPSKYALWNDRTRKALQKIKTDQIPRSAFKSGKISGSDYVKCNEIMTEISGILIDEGYESEDLDLDLFIAWVSDMPSPPPPPVKKPKDNGTVTTQPEPPSPSDMNHWDAIGMITEIGNALKFDTFVADPTRKYREKELRETATIKDVPEQCKGVPGIEKIDAIWFGQQPPIYMFEVEYGGNMRDALLRLYQARFLTSRFLVVCPAENKSKFKKWANVAPFKTHMQMYQFRSFDQLRDMYVAVMNYDRARSQFLSESDPEQ